MGVFVSTSETYQNLAYCGRTRFLLFTATYSICFGICNGQGYTIPLKICWDLFPNNRGMVTGVITFGFGIGSFAFGILSTLLINPNNLKMEKVGKDSVYGPEVADNVMVALRKLAVCWVVLTIIALFLIKIEQKEEQNIENKEEACEIEEQELTLY